MKPVSPAYLATIVIVFLATFGGTVWYLRYEPLPDFGTLEVQAKKNLFFGYLQPKIEQVNADISATRQDLLELDRALASRAPSWRERRFIESLAAEYKVTLADPPDYAATLDLLMYRVDVIPPSLVLIQAAKESGWGTSKFAVQGNNLFGQQCFVAGCGFVPSARDVGRRHEVARFASVDDAVAAYLHNLNTHPRYRRLREIRANSRAANADLKGAMLADGLLAYSERGAAYVTEVKAMIRQNGLE